MENKDQRKEMIGRLLAQFAGKKRIEGLVSTEGNILNGFEKILMDLVQKRNIDTAEGVQLDGLGQIVVQDRVITKALPGSFFGFYGQPAATGFNQARFRKWYEDWRTSTRLRDPEYRRLIIAKVFRNNADWTTEDIIHLLLLAFDTDIAIVVDAGNAKINISIGRKLTDEDILFAESVGLISKAGGVGIIRKSHFNKQFFGFQHQKYATGFGQSPFAVLF